MTPIRLLCYEELHCLDILRQSHLCVIGCFRKFLQILLNDHPKQSQDILHVIFYLQCSSYFHRHFLLNECQKDLHFDFVMA
ncbi:hypothetical protein HanLR1_Chr07g0240941 [Helianthus annuus]|nr:hypothetical protein HanLR1_Chr07g0240941 [Helianthus annuus]